MGQQRGRRFGNLRNKLELRPLSYQQHPTKLCRLVVERLEERCLLAAGSLDPTFDGDGRVVTPIGIDNDFGRAVAIQFDGKIVVAGIVFDGTPNQEFGLARYNLDGSLDSTFDGDGKTFTSIPGGDDVPSGIALQSDGRIVVVGYTRVSSSSDYNFAVHRYLTNGSLDPSFGTGGRVVTSFVSGNEGGQGVVMQSDGKIVVAGFATVGSQQQIAIARYDANGALDTTFDTDGLVTTPIGSGDAAANSVVLQDNGRILVAGYATTDGNKDFAVVRYTSAGVLDGTFSADGIETTPIGTGNDQAFALALQADGGIVLAGESHNGSNLDFALARYTSNGTLDTTFDFDGKVVTPVGAQNDSARDVLIQPDQTIIAVGNSVMSPNVGLALGKYTSAGALDATYGTGGISVPTVGFAAFSFGNTAAQQSDGKIVIVGTAASSTNDFAVARVLGDQVSAVGNFVWNDLDGDGLQDAGEPGIAGVSVRLLDTISTQLASTVTDGSGQYAFTGLTPGNYVLQFLSPFGYIVTSRDVGTDDAIDSDADPTTGKSAVISLAAGQTDVGWDAGMHAVPDTTFLPPISYSFSGQPTELQVGDFNEDGKIDLVAGSEIGGTPGVLFGNGDGTFQTVVPFSGLSRPIAVAVDDFNNDNHLDILFANYIDGNGTAQLFLGTGTGTFTSGSSFSIGKHVFSIATGDFNSDDKSDLVADHLNISALSVMLGNGNGTFQAGVDYGTNFSYVVTVADFNSDGYQDIAASSYASTNLSLLLGNGNGTFQPSVDIPVGDTQRAVTSGDFDRDGKFDLVTINQPANRVSVLLGNGNGTFQAAMNYALGTSSEDISIGDFNADGKQDLITTNYHSDDISVLLGNGDGTFRVENRFAAGDAPNWVVVADFNHDGLDDAAVSNAISQNISIFISRYTAAPTTTTVTSSTNSSVFGQNVTFTATVSSGGGMPGGTVTFMDGSTVLGTGLVPQPTSWSNPANLPAAREALAAARGPDGRIYAIGGDYGAGARSSTVETYDPSTNTWATVASIAIARGYFAAATGPDGRIYAIGGYDGSTVYNTVESYNPSTNTWTTVASMPTARRNLAAVTGPDGRIYALGGFHGGGLNTVEAYNTSTNTWAAVASMPTARSSLAAAVGYDGRIYTFGGASGGAVNVVEVYDTTSNTWTTAASMPTARYNLAVAVGPDGRIYAIGGENGSGTVLNVVEVYNPMTDSWTTVASMPTARETAAAATGLDGRVYVIGGNNQGGPLNVVEALNFTGSVMSISTSGLSPGIHTITAVYGGNPDFAGSTSAPLTLVVSDSPTIEKVYPADMTGIAAADPIEQGERLTSSVPKLVVVFSENMATTGMANINSAHNWQVKRNGVDVTSQISGITFGLNATTNRYEALISFGTPLTDGVYDLTARSALTDLVGNRLDGDFDGSGLGEDYRHRFTIAQPTTTGGEFQINTFTTGNQSTPVIAVGHSGEFVVAWSSSGQDGSGDGIYAQRFDAAGSSVGSELRVNSYTSNDQSNPSIAIDSSGDFVVVWQSYGQDGDRWGVFAQRFSAAGIPQGGEFQVSSFVTSFQFVPRVAMNANGDFAVVWQSDQDSLGWGIYGRRYAASGVPQGSEFRVHSNTTAFNNNVALAMHVAGDFVVVWQSHHDGSEDGIFAQRYNAEGITLGTEFRVNSYTTNQQEAPKVAIDADGDFLISWISFAQDGGSGTHKKGVYAQRYDAQGMPLGSEFRVNTFTTDEQAHPPIGVDADGDFVITWHSSNQDGSGFGVYAQRYNAEGAPQGSEFLVNSVTTSSQNNPSVGMTPNGDFVITWMGNGQDGDGYGIYARRFIASSRVNEIRVAGDTSLIDPGERLVRSILTGDSLEVTFSREMATSGPGSTLSLSNWQLTKDAVDVTTQITGIGYAVNRVMLTLGAPLGEGNYVLTAKSAIQDADGRGLDGDANGTPGGDFTRAFSIQLPVATGSEFRVNTYTTGTQGGFNLTAQAVAADAAGDYVVTWTSDGPDGSSYGIYAQRYNSAGLPLGGEFRVNSYTTGLQLLSTVAMSDTGDFVVTWSDFGGFGSTHTGVFAQRYNAVGVPQGSEFQVNTHTTGAHLLSSAAMDADGDFVVTWSSSSQDGGGYGVYARRFSANGVPQGSEFRVNTYTTSSQRNSAVSMDASGNFVVVWQSYEQDGSQYGIYAQRYSANGTPLGSEFRASTATISQQRFATVASDDSGDFVIAWASVQDGGIFGIYGQRFDSSGAPQGSEFRANSFTTDMQQYARVAIDSDGDFVVTWKSNGQDGSDYGIYGQRFNSAGTAQGSEFQINSTTASRQSESAVAMDSDGDFIVVWSSLNQDGSNYGVYAQRFQGSPPVQIVSMTPTYSGFEIEFNRDVNPTVLNLYDEGGALGVADVTLTGASTGAVRGSVVIEPGSHKLTFIKSGGRLAPDVYTIGLRSNAAGFIDPSGSLLDGNGEGNADDYLARFTITPPPTAVTLGIADFTRGYGQAVNLPAAASTGLPITISNALGVKSASFALVYDPALLSITGVTLGSGIVGTVSLDTTLVGIARITITSGTQLSATGGAQTLVNLTASVPIGAPYSAKEILKLSSIQLTDTTLAAISALDDNGIHVAAYLGDANGSQTYNAPDATAAQRLIVGSNSGFGAYQLADPYLIADVTGNDAVQSDDVTQIQRAIVGLSTAQIPPHPGMSPAVTGGPDPIISIPQNLTASVGDTITVPVELLVTEPTGITLAGADIAIAYDASTFELTDADIGQLLIGFGLSMNTSTPGLIRLSLGGSALDLAYFASGVLATLEFTVIAGGGMTSRINLLQSFASQQTALYDAAGRALTLSPAPTNRDNDEVDGLISILRDDLRGAAWEVPVVDMAFDGDDDFTTELIEELVALIDGEHA